MADHSAEDLVPRLQAVMARGGTMLGVAETTAAVMAPTRSHGAEPVGAGTVGAETWKGRGTR